MRLNAIVTVALVACSRSAAPSFSSSPEAMRSWARTTLEKQLPQWSIDNDSDPLTLKLQRGERDIEVWLGRPFEYCKNNATDCERMAREYLAEVVRAAVESGAGSAIEPGQLLPAVRSGADVKAYRMRVEGMLEEPIAGDLFLIYVIDAPRSASVVDGKAISALGLSSAQIKVRAFENLNQQLPKLSALIHSQDEEAVGEVRLDNFYTSSLLVPHSAWTPIANSFDGKLLVAVPAPDVLLYASERVPSAVRILAEKTRQVFHGSPRGTSLSVLRWTPSGWTVALQP